jgi:hypothetical protein
MRDLPIPQEKAPLSTGVGPEEEAEPVSSSFPGTSRRLHRRCDRSGRGRSPAPRGSTPFQGLCEALHCGPAGLHISASCAASGRDVSHTGSPAAVPWVSSFPPRRCPPPCDGVRRSKSVVGVWHVGECTVRNHPPLIPADADPVCRSARRCEGSGARVSFARWGFGESGRILVCT